MSVYPDAELDSSGPGQAISEVSPFLVDLPVGEGNAVVRLSQIAHTTESHPTASSLVDARTIVTLSGFAPPTLHAMGIRVATTFSARQFNLLITNVPGAQKQMYVAGTKLLPSGLAETMSSLVGDPARPSACCAEVTLMLLSLTVPPGPVTTTAKRVELTN